MRVGIDIGGTTISVALLDSGEMIQKSTIATEAQRGFSDVIERLKTLLHTLLDGKCIEAIGIGCAGQIDSENGVVVYSNNIDWNNVPLCSILTQEFKVPVFIANDAICSTLGEYHFGEGKKASSFLMITLGTGIGGGLVIDNKLYMGSNNFAAIIGHMVIDKNGIECNCGRKGCFEALASTSALVRFAEEAAKNNPSSLLAKVKILNGKTIFECIKKGDETALSLFDEYTTNLAIGLANFINILNPEVIVLSGGICKEGEFLLSPIRSKIKNMLYCKDKAMPVIKVSKLKDDAGLFGATCLGDRK